MNGRIAEVTSLYAGRAAGVEMVSNEVRTFCGFAIELFFSFGECLVGILALWIKDWWALQLAIALPIFVFVSYWL